MVHAGSQRAQRHSSSSTVLIVLLVVLSMLFGGAAIFMWQRYSSIMRRQVCGTFTKLTVLCLNICGCSSA